MPFPPYVTSVHTFTCPTAGDRTPRIRRLPASAGEPFREDEAPQVSYAYSYDGSGGKKRSWTEAAPSTTIILADRHAGKTLNKRSNHRDGRAVAYADGHVRWIPGKDKLLTDPDNPDRKISTQSWWSERPDQPRKWFPF